MSFQSDMRSMVVLFHAILSSLNLDSLILKFPTFSGDQYAWLKKDLQHVDRSTTPWLVASWHSPWYNSYSSHYQEFECMRQEMEALLYHYHVDIVFAGHVSHNVFYSSSIVGSFDGKHGPLLLLFCIFKRIYGKCGV